MRFALLAALALLVGCDTGGTVPEMPPEEDPEPITIAYEVSAPASIQKVIIRYTDADGSDVLVAPERVNFPFTFALENLPATTTGTFQVSIDGSLPSGNVVSRVTATQDGLTIASDQTVDSGSAAEPGVRAEASVTIN